MVTCMWIIRVLFDTRYAGSVGIEYEQMKMEDALIVD